MFTRMMLSLVATGIAPGSFYELDADGNRQRAHYDGLPVEFIAEAIATLGAGRGERVSDLPRDEPLRRRHRARRIRRLAQRGRLPDPADRRLQRLAAAVRNRDARTAGTPAPALAAATAALLAGTPRSHYAESLASTERFHAAVQEAKVGPDKDIPHVTAELIVKYITDLQLLGLL